MCVLLLMGFYNQLLNFCHTSWDQWKARAKKTIAPTFSQVMNNQALQDTAIQPDPIPHSKTRIKKSKPSYRRLGQLLTVLTCLGSSSPFELCSDKDFRTNTLRKHRCYNGVLNTQSLNPQEIHQLQHRIKSHSEQFSMATKHHPDIMSAIVDTGANHAIFNNCDHVDPLSIRKLSEPVMVGGIADGLPCWYVATTNCEVVNEDGNVIPIQEQVLINEQLPFPIFSPQAFMSHKANGGKGVLPPSDFAQLKTDPDEVEEHFRVFHNRAEWHMQGRRILNIPFDENYLPRLALFRKGTALPALTALNSVLSPDNKNLSNFQKTWLRWHIKLGHLSFARVQQMALGGLLDKLALGLNKAMVGHPPKCAACAHGRQTRTPDKTTITKKVEAAVGKLKEGILTPGKRIYSDQLESRVLGRLFTKSLLDENQTRTSTREPLCSAMGPPTTSTLSIKFHSVPTTPS